MRARLAAIACGGLAACLLKPGAPKGTADAPVLDAGGSTANYMFVLSSPVQLAGVTDLTTLDMMCSAAGNSHGMPGHYIAWVSRTGVRDAIDLLGSAEGWLRPDGTPVVDRPSDLTGLAFFYPPRLDENGMDLLAYPPTPPTYVVTGTSSLGRADPTGDCSSGSAAVGLFDADDKRWTDSAGEISCTTDAHVFCFGTDHAVQVAPVIDPGDKIAFVSTVDFTPSSEQAADNQCQMEAGALPMQGTFKALLASTSHTLAMKVMPDGGWWRRVDGVRITNDLVTWLAPLDITATGTRRRPLSFAFTGAATPDAMPVSSDTCDDWSSGSGSAVIGDPSRSMPARALGINIGASCSSRALYCFQL